MPTRPSPRRLGATATAGKRIVVLTGTIISPSTKATIAALRNKYGTPMTAADGQTAVGGVDHVQYDTISYSGRHERQREELRQAGDPELRPHQGRCGRERGRRLPQQLGQHHRACTWQYANRRDPKAR
jgi:hypothetical protein